MKLTLEETLDFWAFFDQYMRDGGQRRGQAMMNALWRVSQRKYRAIHSTDADCFYLDDRIPTFRERLGI